MKYTPAETELDHDEVFVLVGKHSDKTCQLLSVKQAVKYKGKSLGETCIELYFFLPSIFVMSAQRSCFSFLWLSLILKVMSSAG